MVDAFSATLQEARDADLLLHVVDASSPEHPEQVQNVMQVLHDIGAATVPQILVFNKLDAIAPDHRPHQTQDWMELEGVSRPRIFLSAQTGEGLSALRGLIAQSMPAENPAEIPENRGVDSGTDGLGTIST